MGWVIVGFASRFPRQCARSLNCSAIKPEPGLCQSRGVHWLLSAQVWARAGVRGGSHPCHGRSGLAAPRDSPALSAKWPGQAPLIPADIITISPSDACCLPVSTLNPAIHPPHPSVSESFFSTAWKKISNDSVSPVPPSNRWPQQNCITLAPTFLTPSYPCDPSKRGHSPRIGTLRHTTRATLVYIQDIEMWRHKILKKKVFIPKGEE